MVQIVQCLLNAASVLSAMTNGTVRAVIERLSAMTQTPTTNGEKYGGEMRLPNGQGGQNNVFRSARH